MADSSPVILERLASGVLNPAPKSRPDVVLVLSYGNQQLRTFTRTPSMVDRQGSRFCYVIDASQRHASGQLRIPARGDVYFFIVYYDAIWRVTDPEEVVRANVTNGDMLVEGLLSHVMWPMGRSHYADDAAGAEYEIVGSLRTPQPVGNGLTLIGLSVRLVLDQDQAAAVKEVDADAHAGRLERGRVERLQRLVDGDESFLFLHLAQNPGDTGSVLQMVASARERNDSIRLGLLDRMLDRGFIQDADIGPLRDSILGGGSGDALRALPTNTPRAALLHAPQSVTAPHPAGPSPYHRAASFPAAPYPSAAPPSAGPGASPASGPPPWARPTTPGPSDDEPAVETPDPLPPQDDSTAASTRPSAPPAPGNVTTWKPVGRKPDRGAQ